MSTKKKKRWSKIGYASVLVCLVLVLIWAVASEKRRATEYSDWAEATGKEVQDLENERFELQQQLIQMERDYGKRLEGKSCVVLYFDQMDSNLMNVVYPLVSEYGYKGVFAVDDVESIGKGTNLTQEEYQKLLDAGWQAVTTNEKETYERTLHLNVAVIQEREAVVQERLIQTINEGKSQLIITRYVEEQVQDLDVDSSTGRYTNLLEWLKKNEQLVAVKTFSETQAFLEETETTKETAKAEWETARQNIEKRIGELEETIKSIETKRK